MSAVEVGVAFALIARLWRLFCAAASAIQAWVGFKTEFPLLRVGKHMPEPRYRGDQTFNFECLAICVKSPSAVSIVAL
jgi:hypothetical protein